MKLTRFMIALTASLGMGGALLILAVTQPEWATSVMLLLAVGILGQLLLDVDRRRQEQAAARERWGTVRSARVSQS